MTMIYDRIHAIWLVQQMRLRHQFMPMQIQTITLPQVMTLLDWHSVITPDASPIINENWNRVDFKDTKKDTYVVGEYVWTRNQGWVINGMQPYRRARDAGMPFHTCESLVHLTHKTSKEVIPVSLVWSISDSDGLMIWMAEENDTGFPVDFTNFGTTEEEQVEALCALDSTQQTWEESFDGDY